jgi:hypothetical protein
LPSTTLSRERAQRSGFSLLQVHGGRTFADVMG